MRRVTFAGAAALLFAAPAFVRAQGAAGPARSLLRGAVIDDADERPIPGAIVAIEILRLQATTDSAGAFRMPLVPPGRHVVTVKRLGFSPISAVLNFGPADTLEYDFALIRQATNLPGVAVTTTAAVPPKLVEFEERRLAGFGRFITPDVLVKNENRRLSEVIAQLPGPRIMRGWGNYGWVASSVGSGALERRNQVSQADIARGADPKQCYANVMLDGNMVYAGRPGELLFDVNSLGTNAVAAIEYYRNAATIPSKFNMMGNDTCGLLVIWTK